ncbi:MAG: hypothetical protein V4581_00100 [Bacteroidota bacterium]
MSKSKTTTKSVRILNPEAKVYLTITIGNAQIGGTLVKWNDTDGNLGKGIIQNLYLGYGHEISGRNLDLFTNIIDVNPQTNGVVVTYYFHNCDPVTFTLSDSVDNEGDIFSFRTHINFTS